MPEIIHLKDPLLPQLAEKYTLPDGSSLRDFLSQINLEEFPVPTVCLLNGDHRRPLLRRDWGHALPEDVPAVLVTLPQGGDGSNPMQAVLMIALAAGAMWAGPYVAGTMMGMTNAAGALTAGGMLASGLVSSAVMMGGSLLVNAMIPPSKLPSTQELDAPSPTYGISASGNMIRKQQAIPNPYGRNKIMLDWCAEPWAEYRGNTQYLYQLFCIGHGEYEIEQIYIGDTAVENFGDEVEYEIVGPDTPVTLFPDNVSTSGDVAGQELLGINEEGADYIGPFPICAAANTANYVAFDYLLPGGLFYANDSGGLDSRTIELQEEIREIDSSGAAIGEWIVVGTPVITDATNTPQRISHKYALPSRARYEGQVKRTNNADTDVRTSDTIQWSGLRAYLPSIRTYGDLTLIAMVMRVEGNLAGQSNHRVSCVCTRKLEIYDPVSKTWSARTATHNPAWAFAHVCRASYCGNLDDSRIDLDKIASLAETWETRGDTFDYVFDSRMSWGESAQIICRVGRAVPMDQAGLMTVIRDEPQTVYSTGFDMRNIVRGSLSIERMLPTLETPDHVIVEFFSADKWDWDEVECILPGGSSENPERRKMPGVSTRQQAWREGMYMAACNRDQRTFPTLTTELEGLIPSFGAHVPVSHDLPQWGYSGEIVSVSADGLTLETSERLSWTAGDQHYVGLSLSNGSMAGPYPVSQGTDDFSMVLDSALGWSPYTGGDRERTRYMFGPGTDKWCKVCRVIGIIPRGGTKVQLLLVNAADSVHTADQGEAPTPPVTSLLPKIPDAPVVSGLRVVPDATIKGLALASWYPAARATSYIVQMSLDSLHWTTIATPAANTLTFNVPTGTIYVRVAGIGAIQGPFDYWSGIVGAPDMPPAAVTNLALQTPFTSTYCKVQWSESVGATYYLVEVWADYGDGSGSLLRRDVTVTDLTYTYSLDDAIEDNGPVPSFTIKVAAGNATGESSFTSIQVTNSAPAVPANIATTVVSQWYVQVDWDAVAATDLAGYRLWRSTTQGFTPLAASLVYEGPLLTNTDNGTSWDSTYYFRLASYDKWGNQSSLSDEFSATTDPYSA